MVSLNAETSGAAGRQTYQKWISESGTQLTSSAILNTTGNSESTVLNDDDGSGRLEEKGGETTADLLRFLSAI